MRYLASRTFFSVSPLARIITGLIKGLSFWLLFFVFGVINLYCSRMSRSMFILTCKRYGTLLARCFLKIESTLSGRCSGERVFPTTNLNAA